MQNYNERKRPILIRILNALIILLGFAIWALGFSVLLIHFFGSSSDEYSISLQESSNWADLNFDFNETGSPSSEVFSSSIDGNEYSESIIVDSWETGQQLFEQGEWKEATEALINAIDQYPDNDQIYLMLAKAYYQMDDEVSAAETLQAGLAQTGSEALQEMLSAVEVTRDMPSLQRKIIQSIYQTITAGDQEVLLTEMKKFWLAEYDFEPLEGWVYFEDLSLVWDGERFWDSYDGTAVLFQGNQVYYGDIIGVTPQGHGILIKPGIIRDTESSFSITYLQMECDWVDGTANNHFVLQKVRSRNEADTFIDQFYLEGVLDNSIDEGILEAEGIISFISPYNEEGRRHEFPIALKDGKLQQSTMTQVFESYVVPCSVHSDCECEIIFSQEDFDINYRNICRWNMPASLEEVLQFLNPTYSYRKF